MKAKKIERPETDPWSGWDVPAGVKAGEWGETLVAVPLGVLHDLLLRMGEEGLLFSETDAIREIHNLSVRYPTRRDPAAAKP